MDRTKTQVINSDAESEDKEVFEENDILAGLIVDDKFIGRMSQIDFVRLLSTDYGKKVSGWCLKYHSEFGKAPKSSITEIFKWECKKLKREATKDNIRYLLEITSDRYGDQNEQFDFDNQIKNAEKYLRIRRMQLIHKEQERLLEVGSIEEAENIENEYPLISLANTSNNSLKDALQNNTLVMSFRDLEELDLPELQKIIEGDILIEEETITLVSGPPGIGKTFLILEAMKVAASGETGLGNKLKSTGGYKCLYVDGELPERRLRKMSRALDLDNYLNLDVISKATADRLGFKPEFNLMSVEVREWLTELITRNGYKLVALDNIFSLFQGLPLNGAEDWSPINSWLLKMRSKGISFILLHHTNKAKDQLGSISKLFNLDSSLILEEAVANDKIKKKTACFKIRIQKDRDGSMQVEGKKYVFRNKVWWFESIRIDESKVRKAIILKELVDGKLSQEEIGTLVGRTKQYVNGIKADGLDHNKDEWLIMVGGKIALTKKGQAFIDEWYKEDYFKEKDEAE